MLGRLQEAAAFGMVVPGDAGGPRWGIGSLLLVQGGCSGAALAAWAGGQPSGTASATLQELPEAVNQRLERHSFAPGVIWFQVRRTLAPSSSAWHRTAAWAVSKLSRVRLIFP